MKFNDDIKVFGDVNYRNPRCPIESTEQITFFNELKIKHPEIAMMATHVKNEGKKTIGTAVKDAREGLNAGFPDIVIVGSPVCLIELKRVDHTKSKWQKGQKEFLIEAEKRGAFACVALGYKGALLAVEAWIDAQR